MKARCVRSLEEAAAGSRRRQPADQGLLIEQPRRGDRSIGLLRGSRVWIELDYGMNAELQGRSPVATSWLRAGRLRFPWAVAQGYLLSPLRGLGSLATEALIQCKSSLNRLRDCAVREHFASSTCCNLHYSCRTTLRQPPGAYRRCDCLLRPIFDTAEKHHPAYAGRSPGESVANFCVAGSPFFSNQINIEQPTRKIPMLYHCEIVSDVPNRPGSSLRMISIRKRVIE